MRIRLDSTARPPGPLTRAVLDAAPADVDEAIALALRIGDPAPVPGEGGTLDLWEALATAAAGDLAVARAIEPHLDAAAVLAQAGRDGVLRGALGVFAAEGGDEPLRAREEDGRWRLDGVKPWCSLADRLDGALVTAWTSPQERTLFAVDLRSRGVRVVEGRWQARGLVEVPSGPVRFDGVVAEPIGGPGWYLHRPGFALGGVSVAACWHGGAIGVARTMHAALVERDDPHALAHLGAVDELVESSRRALAEAAILADAGAPGLRLVARRVRATVARAADEVIARAGRALGPAPLALDAGHAKRIADLQLYVRQHHAERDLAALGASILEGAAPW